MFNEANHSQYLIHVHTQQCRRLKHNKTEKLRVAIINRAITAHGRLFTAYFQSTVLYT